MQVPEKQRKNVFSSTTFPNELRFLSAQVTQPHESHGVNPLPETTFLNCWCETDEIPGAIQDWNDDLLILNCGNANSGRNLQTSQYKHIHKEQI
jgi:hypothetical protein